MKLLLSVKKMKVKKFIEKYINKKFESCEDIE